MSTRPGPTTAPIQSMPEGAWYDRLIAPKVDPNPNAQDLGGADAVQAATDEPPCAASYIDAGPPSPP